MISMLPVSTRAPRTRCFLLAPKVWCCLVFHNVYTKQLLYSKDQDSLLIEHVQNTNSRSFWWGYPDRRMTKYWVRKGVTQGSFSGFLKTRIWGYSCFYKRVIGVSMAVHNWVTANIRIMNGKRSQYLLRSCWCWDGAKVHLSRSNKTTENNPPQCLLDCRDEDCFPLHFLAIENLLLTPHICGSW